MKILVITSEWPSKNYPNDVPFLVEHIQSLEKLVSEIKVVKVKIGSIWKYFQSINKINRILKINNYNIIHTHWGWNGLIGCWFSLPHIITFHGSDLNLPVKWSIRNITIQFISQLSSICTIKNIFVSSKLKNQAIIKSNKNEIIPIGLNLEKFKPMDKNEARHILNIPLDKKVILFGGNESQPVKRVQFAKKAIKQLGEEYALLTINYENHENIPLYMNSADALLMTSKSEGSPMMVKEALACNLPVVSTNVGDVKSMIDGLDNCHIIYDESPNNIAKIVEKCISNRTIPNGRGTMINYSIDAIANQVYEVYKSVLGEAS